MNELKGITHIRRANKLYPIVRDSEDRVQKLDNPEVFPSISQAKHTSAALGRTRVRRYESLEREHGKFFVKELFK